MKRITDFIIAKPTLFYSMWFVGGFFLSWVLYTATGGESDPEGWTISSTIAVLTVAFTLLGAYLVYRSTNRTKQ